MIFASNFFLAIQTAVLYKKNAPKMFKSNLFMFLGLLVSCDIKKNYYLQGASHSRFSTEVLLGELCQFGPFN